MDKHFKEIKDCSLVVLASQECRKKYRLQRALEIENYMIPLGFVSIDVQLNAMFEMYIMVYVRRELATDISAVRSAHIEKGLWGMVGNKGAVAYSFKLKNRQFNFIACHLRHGQDKQAERDAMASELIQELRLQEMQTVIEGVESDSLSEFGFFFGDLNYRLNTDFAHLNSSNIKEAIDMF